MKAFVMAEHTDAARALCAGARQRADEVVFVAVIGTEVPDAIADRIVVVALPQGAVYDDAADTVAAVFDAEAPDFVYAEPTRRMKAIVGKLAARAGASVITDVLAFDGDAATSMYFGGVGERTQRPTGAAFYTVVPDAFADAQPTGANVVEHAAWVLPEHPLELVSCKPREKSGVDLNKADVVVAAGRGFAEEPELDLARELCGKLGAGLACSRPLTEGVDWLPTELYVGVSGLMLSPKVYVAVGVSGQMQHMVGANRSQTVVAVNKDKNAPVFKQCDYGIVGDLKTVLPALAAAL